MKRARSPLVRPLPPGTDALPHAGRRHHTKIKDKNKPGRARPRAVTFRVYDQDGDGFVSPAELEATLRRLAGQALSAEQLAEVRQPGALDVPAAGQRRAWRRAIRDALEP